VIRKATTEDLNYLVNHPLIRPHTGFPDDGLISMDVVLLNPCNIGLLDGDIGGMLFGSEGEHEFSCHFLFIPGSGGFLIKETARAMLDQMFTKYGAHVIRGYPPRDNRAVRSIGVALGFKKIPKSDFIDDLGRPCDVYELRKTDG
jgi:hypothetical protein